MNFMKKICVAAFFLVAVFSPQTAEASSFGDLDRHWSKPYVELVAREGILRGYRDATFRPESTMSRAEFYALINRLSGASHRFTVTFSDVEPGAWYYEEVARAVKSGYLEPTTGKLHPNRSISREEAFAVLAELYDLEGNVEFLDFKDKAQIESGKAPRLAGLVEEGHIRGTRGGYFYPKAELKRGEVAFAVASLTAKEGRPSARWIPDSKIRFGSRRWHP